MLTTRLNLVDFVNKFTGGDDKKEEQHHSSSSGEEKKEGGGFFGGIGDKLNSAAGGGKESEKNEDMLDKGEAGVAIEICIVADYTQVSTLSKRSSSAKALKTMKYAHLPRTRS